MRTNGARWLALLLLGLGHSSAEASGISLDDVVPNFFGVGAGVTTQWYGSKESMAGAIPGARIALDKGRFVEWYGPYLGMNLVQDTHWEAGPVLNVRLGRSEVDDPVVATLPEFGMGLEAGGFVGWHYLNTEGIPYRVRTGLMAITSVAGQTEGSSLSPYASLWVPLSRTLFVGLGGGATWSDDDFMQQFFSIDAAGSAASGLAQFQAEAGFRQVYIWPALMWRVSEQWMVGAGIFCQHLLGDAAASPIVSERGDENQWSGGVGIGYLW
ncbi:MAG: MipA/OmpV family protein [Aeromonadaceae bacterium]